MPVVRLLAARSVEPHDIKLGRVEPHYVKVLERLLAAHALAEKLAALGYERAYEKTDDPELRAILSKNLAEEKKHAGLVYGLLEELGVNETAAGRMTVRVLKAPSFAAPRRFAEQASDELDFVMGGLSVDVTGLMMIGINYRDSSYAPHARAADEILEDEAEHESFTMEQIGQAMERFGQDRVSAALAQWLPAAMNFFGPPGSGFTYDCIRFGLKVVDNQELAELFLAKVSLRLGQLGVAMPRLTATYPRALAGC
jgi:1,2-phenylacetyl-CoA epoxidase catalytic subunit